MSEEVDPLDPDWGPSTADNHFEWVPREAGTYTFEVQSVDRNLRRGQDCERSGYGVACRRYDVPAADLARGAAQRRFSGRRRNRAGALLSQIEGQHATLASSLADLVSDFRFEEIMTLANITSDTLSG